ncbi:MAG: hypothetical protein Q8P84_03375 [Deltaproteobacteria bacterium]|nr:hypothetical protein [Deltaproteobacteria bacterium]MDZ4224624.1 hypothetical protein [bacterium]
MTKLFENILLLGRPASGKSEFIDFMKKVSDADRAAQYHIGNFKEMDDFPWIWEKFIEDALWEKAGYPRRFSFGGENPGLSKEGAPLFDFCMAKFNAEYAKHYLNNEAFYKEGTLFIEFARGGQNAYGKALNQLSKEVLKRSAILFVLVSYEESCRRNNARYQEKLQHSILAHKVPDETMQNFYRTHDWLELTNGQESGSLNLQGGNVPFVTMNNEPESTDPVLLNKRYGAALRRLMEIKNAGV